ncbi:MAG: hypothetical protein A2509_00230 [Candidatus Edwardsbacteria bacterium RIFOXYD12_FULL_50_11]|uniref:Uncharacterized protein n=1 Tax=Candidatus Edwardsbacteria bacterium GWF2_54_11 TaxID=1817851 RepID=A0A1F5RHP1_9BACT|nr:MAG: hypothetical protein A2502_00895 [Candidatus Edwardsbacteria bacterium RifOxyC12_full_54_24]OGF06142.1 MAG: hypothetical protein A2273_11285 [Candidatus Edwardsbacteria bacterium RifOxyA12_full_54_48]OGF12591.1 MAG: hypothetical protein A3K15_01985 [Candidatus Edwardsbacteria bacterium GWE2_54_12]OGF13872.1 MAG: hypothetical protein A2024_10525 [Candidatus Edwardsbacteria bacterium GWF2_54_11]OGF17570.1 MAG: hypothetical protein A2509_00230 [Candidatus Edwardsbacteria bacterium RIFOXYD1
MNITLSGRAKSMHKCGSVFNHKVHKDHKGFYFKKGTVIARSQPAVIVIPDLSLPCGFPLRHGESLH